MKTQNIIQPWYVAPALGIVGAMIILIVYLPGTSGALYYDDYSNLGRLAAIASFSDAWKFVFDGHAGPLGRPLALASFLPHSDSWPASSNTALLVNVLIHCLNFILLYFMSRLIMSRVTDFSSKKIAFASLSAALMWALLPILASTSLIVIQRMTGLSTLLGLIGLLGFVAAYKYGEKSPKLTLFLQMGSLGVGTFLAIFAKESAALFPVYALIIDMLVFKNLKANGLVPKIRRTILCIPLLFILYYISPLNINWMNVHELRGFTPLERLNTQAVIMWEYLLRAFLPQQPTGFGPFHDYYGVKPIGAFTLAAIASWLALVGLAIHSSKKFPIVTFGILWYVGGHLIESTTVMLELYFEHRNYMALYGPCLALTLALWSGPGKLRKVLPLVQVTYICLLAVITFSLTSLWGTPSKAADIWAVKHPGSARAVLHSVFHEMEIETANLRRGNQQFIEKERYYNALKLLDRTKGLCPDCINVRLQAMLYSCVIEEEQERIERFKEIEDMAKSADLNPGVIDMLFNLNDFTDNNVCPPLTHNNLISLFQELERNQQLLVPEYGGKILFLKAMSMAALGDHSRVYDALDAAEAISPNALPILQFQVHYSLGNNDLEYAQAALARRSPYSDSYLLDEKAVSELKHLLESKALEASH